MKVVQCPQCGAKIHKSENGSYVCEYCGSVMQLDEATSPSTAATESATVAPVAQQKPVYDPTVTYTKTGERYVRKKKKEKWLAIVLCVTFGIFGAHRFYEGKKRSGILYLCTLGLLFCGVVYDFIQLLSRPEYYYPEND